MSVTGMFDRFPASHASGFDELVELALDMRWSWNHSADEIWRQIDPVLWDHTHNPWVILQSTSAGHIERLVSQPAFSKKVAAVVRAKQDAAREPGWFQQSHAQSSLECVAYFSMEYMLSEALPIYSGGLGNVAGDQLKAASDLGVPVIAIGLLYSQGYFRQIIDQDGSQQALYPFNDPGQLPITPVRGPDGDWLRLKINLPGYPLWIRAWHVQIGSRSLYLLDSNDMANVPALRGITSELYGGGPELRLQQELLLGIGGWRLLEALGITPEVCHLNEGHAAFAILERARSFMRRTGESFATALCVTRAGNVFTTHTAVAAGFDRFDPALIERYLSHYAESELGITPHALLALGRQNEDDATEPFNMANLAMRGSGAVNGVSRLHGEVSRRLFSPLFPRWPQAEVPVNHVTNGVHTPSWDSAEADRLWTDACGKDRWVRCGESVGFEIRSVSDRTLWKMRNQNRSALVAYAREMLSKQLAASIANAESVEAARHVLDPDTLTVGFARRFATYKRPNLLLHDQERLLRLLNHATRPVQLVIAGKAHPADGPGQELIRQWTDFIRNTPARNRVVFLSDYDMMLAEQLVQGVDVWLNTPRRPWEACGTSGMKVLVNGAINLSVLDGWWAEAYAPELGWALGDGLEQGNDPAQDTIEAEALFDLLEREVVPEFYSRNSQDIPEAWTGRMRESMSQLTDRFSASRAVRDYTEQYYLPAAARYRQRKANDCAIGKEIVEWQDRLQQRWGQVRFTEAKVETRNAQHVFEFHVDLAGLDPSDIRAQLYCDENPDRESEIHDLQLVKPAMGVDEYALYRVTIPGNQPAESYTARLIPHHAGVDGPLEDARILWQW